MANSMRLILDNGRAGSYFGFSWANGIKSQFHGLCARRREPWREHCRHLYLEEPPPACPPPCFSCAEFSVCRLYKHISKGFCHQLQESLIGYVSGALLFFLRGEPVNASFVSTFFEKSAARNTNKPCGRRMATHPIENSKRQGLQKQSPCHKLTSGL